MSAPPTGRARFVRIPVTGAGGGSRFLAPNPTRPLAGTQPHAAATSSYLPWSLVESDVVRARLTATAAAVGAAAHDGGVVTLHGVAAAVLPALLPAGFTRSASHRTAGMDRVNMGAESAADDGAEYRGAATKARYAGVSSRSIIRCRFDVEYTATSENTRCACVALVFTFWLSTQIQTNTRRGTGVRRVARGTGPRRSNTRVSTCHDAVGGVEESQRVPPHGSTHRNAPAFFQLLAP